MPDRHRPPITEQITFLPARDLARTADFYERVLGLEAALDQVDCRVYRVARDAYLGFCQRESVDPPGSGVILTLVTPDVDGWYARLQSAGIAFERPPAHNPTDGIYHCFLADPNGYTIEIQRFDDDGWNANPEERCG